MRIESMNLDEVAVSLGVRGEVEALSIHGVPAITKNPDSGIMSLLIVLKENNALKIKRKRVLPNLSYSVIIGGESLAKDSSDEVYGGVAAHLFLFPYLPMINGEKLHGMEEEYKRHIIVESLRNLILEHQLASSRVVIKPEYFLYEKLRRLSVTYPPSRPLIRAVFTSTWTSKAVKMSIKGFERAITKLVEEGILTDVGEGYSPTPSFVEEVLSSSTVYQRLSDELEHAFRLYLTSGQASSLDFLRNVEFNFKTLIPPRLPDPSRMLYIQTSLGLQPLMEKLGIRELVEKVYGINASKVKVKRIGGVLNSAYVASFKTNGGEERIFMKKFLNWTDFKWVIAWLWALGVKNFSVLASTRMGNEIFFVNKLAELGFNTAEILHVSWPKKIIAQRYINGLDGVRSLLKGLGTERFIEVSRTMGRILAELHSKDITMGDCNPHSFLFTKDGEVYLIDLEQCSFGGLRDWDIAELLFYTAHYLDGDNAEKFASETVKGYLEKGERDVVEGALKQKYSRLLTPWTPIWIQRRVEKGVRKVLETL